MKSTPLAPVRATTRRARAPKRPRLSVVRSRDLPDPPPPHQTAAATRAWVMVCDGYLVWPCPAKPGDKLVFNEFGIRRAREGGSLLERDRVFPPLLTNSELDRLRCLGDLRFSSEWSTGQYARFQLWLTAQSMGINVDRLLPPDRAS